MTDFSTVACVEEAYTRRETQDVESGIAASVTLRCSYGNRGALMSDLLVNRRVWPFGGWAAPPRAQTCSARPFDQQYLNDGQAINYTGDALVDVQYGVNKGGENEDLISESLEPIAEFLTISHKGFCWTNGAGKPLKEGEAPGKQRRSLALVRTLYQVPSPLPVSLINLVGSCNDTAYVSPLLGITFPLETLLFTVPGLSRTIRTDGAKGWNITLAFPYQPDTWNKFWRAETGLYDQIFRIGGAVYKNYPPANFSDFLF